MEDVNDSKLNGWHCASIRVNSEHLRGLDENQIRKVTEKLWNDHQVQMILMPSYHNPRAAYYRVAW